MQWRFGAAHSLYSASENRFFQLVPPIFPVLRWPRIKYASRIERLGTNVQSICTSTLPCCKLMLLIGIFVLYRGSLALLFRQILFNLSEIKVVRCHFQKSLSRFLKNYFFNLHFGEKQLYSDSPC
jgi:hypothetical protein